MLRPDRNLLTRRPPTGQAMNPRSFDQARRARFRGALRAEVFLAFLAVDFFGAVFAVPFCFCARRSARSIGALPSEVERDDVPADEPSAFVTTAFLDKLFLSTAMRSMIFAPPLRSIRVRFFESCSMDHVVWILLLRFHQFLQRLGFLVLEFGHVELVARQLIDFFGELIDFFRAALSFASAGQSIRGVRISSA